MQLVDIELFYGRRRWSGDKWIERAVLHMNRA